MNASTSPCLEKQLTKDAVATLLSFLSMWSLKNPSPDIRGVVMPEEPEERWVGRSRRQSSSSLFKMPNLFPEPAPLFKMPNLFCKPVTIFNAALFTPRLRAGIDPAISRAQFFVPPLIPAVVPDVATYICPLDVETVEALVEEAADPSAGDQVTDCVVAGLLRASDRLTPLMAQCLDASIVWLSGFTLLANAAHREPELAEQVNNVYGVSTWGAAAPSAVFAMFLLRQWEAQHRRRREAEE